MTQQFLGFDNGLQNSSPVCTRDFFEDDNIDNFNPDRDDFGNRNDYSCFKDEDILGDNYAGRPSNYDELAQNEGETDNRMQFDADDISSSDGEDDRRGSIYSNIEEVAK
jgi:hypothetical protein